MTKSIFGKFRKLEKKKKLQLVIAVSISVVLLVALPVYAWFTHKRSIALTTKINAPTQLYITAGNNRLVGMPDHARRVGRALAEAPAGLPCHRVVNSAGRTVPGWTRQRELLEAEGVRFKANGCADLARCGWEEIR